MPNRTHWNCYSNSGSSTVGPNEPATYKVFLFCLTRRKLNTIFHFTSPVYGTSSGPRLANWGRFYKYLLHFYSSCANKSIINVKILRCYLYWNSVSLVHIWFMSVSTFWWLTFCVRARDHTFTYAFIRMFVRVRRGHNFCILMDFKIHLQDCSTWSMWNCNVKLLFRTVGGGLGFHSRQLSRPQLFTRITGFQTNLQEL